MNIVKRQIFTALLLVTLALSSFGASPVWKVSKGQSHIYIGGTVHLLSKEDFPLPNAFEKAYLNSQAVYFEVNINEVNSAEFAQKLLIQNMYVGDDDITKHLKPQTIKQLDDFLETKNMTLDSLKKMKPGFLSLMLATTEMQRLGMAEVGVDQFYSNKAVKDKKKTGALETADEQLKFITNMGCGNEDELIVHSIEELGEIASVLTETKSAWRKGDLKELENAALDTWIDDFPELYKELLVDRNNNWMPQIKAMFGTEETEFILVGALHLSGEQGLIAQLRKAGFKVKQLD
ncbi:MAG: TraB/GumN family protein [Kiritimatiellae bacterium]|jgi:uncharacterized protein YbaP (TraB family)|nr:TraB/GumN family protein [Kiritimatiellia bacterium]